MPPPRRRDVARIFLGPFISTSVVTAEALLPSHAIHHEAASIDHPKFLRGTPDHDSITTFLWDGVGRLLPSAFKERPMGQLLPTTKVNARTPARSPREHPPTPCDVAGPFTIAAPTRPVLDGCYHPRDTYGGEVLYTSQDNLRTGEKVVAGAQINENDPGDIHWILLSVDPDADPRFVAYCYSAGYARDTHPVRASWICGLDGELPPSKISPSELDISCGCPPTTTVPRPPSSETTNSWQRAWSAIHCFVRLAGLTIIFAVYTGFPFPLRIGQRAASPSTQLRKSLASAAEGPTSGTPNVPPAAAGGCSRSSDQTIVIAVDDCRSSHGMPEKTATNRSLLDLNF